MRKVIIVDIDGTISKIGERLKYLQQEPKDWDSFYNDCFEDEPITETCLLIETLSFAYDIVFCTGRREMCREKTVKWLNKYMSDVDANEYLLLMRPDNDHRHDTEVKPELIKNINPNSIKFIFEDRNSMVKKWRELGFTCFQVADGDF